MSRSATPFCYKSLLSTPKGRAGISCRRQPAFPHALQPGADGAPAGLRQSRPPDRRRCRRDVTGARYSRRLRPGTGMITHTRRWHGGARPAARARLLGFDFVRFYEQALGKQLMDALRSRIDAFIDEAERRRAERGRKAEDAARYSSLGRRPVDGAGSRAARRCDTQPTPGGWRAITRRFWTRSSRRWSASAQR